MQALHHGGELLWWLMWRGGVLLSAALLLLAADQATKYLAVRDLTSLFERAGATSSIERVSLFYGEPGIEHLRLDPAGLPLGLHVSYSENRGAALGLLSGWESPLRLFFFSGVALLAGAFVVVMARRAGRGRWASHLALGAILGGVSGNLLCRLTRGYVIDFVGWHIGPWASLPAFNLADLGITVGVVVLLTSTAREVMRRDS